MGFEIVRKLNNSSVFSNFVFVQTSFASLLSSLTLTRQNPSSQNHRGQVAIFIIVAIVIVSGLLLFFFLPDSVRFISLKDEGPKEFIEKCISDSVKDAEGNLIEKNFYLEGRENSILNEGVKVPYLCFVSEFYSTCVPQEPALLGKLKKDIHNAVLPELNRCLASLKKDSERKGYSFSENEGELVISFEDHKIIAVYDGNLFLEKGETSEAVSDFSVEVISPLYNLAKTAGDIVNFESTLCEFDYINWMMYNRDIKISLFVAGDQSEIYTLTDRVSEKKIKFAVKTCVLPAGI